MSQSTPKIPVYVDSSVLVALVAPAEAQHRTARRWIEVEASLLVTSTLTEVEVGRALVRRAAPRAVGAAVRRILDGLELIEITSRIRDAAIQVRPANIRSLDAVHVATALIAGAGQFASLDARQQVAAEEMGLKLVRFGDRG